MASGPNVFAFLDEPLVQTTRDPSASQGASRGLHGNQMYSEEHSRSFGEAIPVISSLVEAALAARHAYALKALECIKMIIHFEHENEDGISTPYKPVMAHQIFDADETISGYRNLQVVLNFLPNSFHCHLDLAYTNTYENPIRGFIRDNIPEKLAAQWFPHLTSLSRFNELQQIEDLNKMYGNVYYTSQFIEGRKTPCNIYVSKCSSADSDFMEFHKRFQAQIVFFIDAASIIQYDDQSWHYFYLYKDIIVKGEVKAKLPIGFCTVYSFKRSEKARISQFFILPNYQQKGLGSRFLGVIYRYLKNNDPCRFINGETIESPCKTFSIMRDKLDLRLIKDLQQFSRAAILCGDTALMERTAQDVAKITNNQTKHLYYLLRFFYTRDNETELSDFLQYMKREIFLHYKGKIRRMSAAERMASNSRFPTFNRIISGDYRLNREIQGLLDKFISSNQSQIRFLTEAAAAGPPPQ